jgi:hypothetical protein
MMREHQPGEDPPAPCSCGGCYDCIADGEGEWESTPDTRATPLGAGVRLSLIFIAASIVVGLGVRLFAIVAWGGK